MIPKNFGAKAKRSLDNFLYLLDDKIAYLKLELHRVSRTEFKFLGGEKLHSSL